MAKKSIFCFRNISLFVLLTMILLYIVWLEVVSSQLRSVKSELRANGVPVSFEDLAEIAKEAEDRENAIDYIFLAGELERMARGSGKFICKNR